MKIPDVITVDFETEAIESRPHYPPRPVGVSIKYPKDRRSHYYAWGHPEGNNIDERNGKRKLLEAWNSGLPILFHNAKFDMDVAETHLGMRRLSWEYFHDSLFLIFFNNPHAANLSLKPSAQLLLGMPPTEQEAVREWLVRAGIVRKSDRNWGAYISKAPGTLVGEYANGDVIRTYKIFRDLYPKIVSDGMLGAYNRERQLLYILLDNERTGLRVDIKGLRRDIPLFNNAHSEADQWLRKRLKTPDLNIDSNDDLADALDRAGVVTDWSYTEKGNRSTSKENMTLTMFKDKRVAQVLGYRNRLSTCLRMFMQPWLEMGQENKGMIHPNWNQVRQSKGEDNTKGTRTGRLSCYEPNLLNLAKNFYDKDDGYEHPSFLRLPELPLVRTYVLPDKKSSFLHRDYNQQELRLLAHFEDGALCQAYRDNPRLDVHNFVRDAIAQVTRRTLERRAVKILNFGIIYAMGVEKIAIKTRTSVEDARQIRNAHRKGMPGIADLEAQIKKFGVEGRPIRTWGGRLYYTEPPRIIKGVEKTYEYKLLNYLIQGSAADVTKEAIIRYNSVKKDSRFLVTVYDEINISAPKNAVKQEMKLLKEAMESIELDVPLTSDGKVGSSWGRLKPYKE